jgi:UDP-2,3-diacylglucosamine hydrolase
MPEGAEKFGLIAGNGQFPFLVLQSAREQNRDVVVAAIKEETSPEIEAQGYPVHWLGLGQLGKLIRVFRDAGVTRAIMAGQVKHIQIFSSSIPDLTMIRMLAGLRHRNTNALIGGIAKIMGEAGIQLVDSTLFLKPHMASEGPLTHRGLSSHEREDVAYGRPIAQSIARMDIGQTIVVRDKAVVAVEAMEGTDAAIRRAASLANERKLTVIKVSKPKQDMRFDVPVVGIPTIETMAACGATALVLDADKTLIFDREQFIGLADRNNIAVVGFPAQE